MAIAANPEGERVEELERTLGVLREDTEIAHVLLGLSGALAEVKSVEETLERAVTIVPELFGADRCFAAAWEPGHSKFTIHAHSGFREDAVRYLQELADESRLPLLRAALTSRVPVLVPDTAADPRIGADEIEARDLGAYIGIPLIRRGQDFGGLGIEFSAPRKLGTKDEALAVGIARQVGVALANARQFNLLQGLRSFGLQITTRLRLDEVIDVVVAGAVDLLSGQRAVLYFLDSSSKMLVAAGASNGGVGDIPERLLRIPVTIDPWARLVDGAVFSISDLDQNLGLQGTATSGIAASIPGHAPILGAILVLFDHGRSLAADDAEALSVLTAHSAMAIENAQRFERQRTVARNLQQGLLAAEMPELEGCEVAAVYEPASGEADIGGDFYDVFEIDEDSFAVVIGDVSGKGAEAAAQTAMVKYMLRAFAMRNRTPASVLFHLNNALVRGFSEDRFATLLYGVLTPADMNCSIAIAGHPPPLLYRAGDNVVDVLEQSGGILGVFEDQQFEQQAFDLGPGDVFLAYTDGLAETRRDNDLYGLQGIKQALMRFAPGAGAADLTRQIYEDAKEFGEVSDDTVVFALARPASAP